jgi:hypothetical protein
MINRIELSQADKDLMAQYNIKVETRTLFYSEGYKYDNFELLATTKTDMPR